MPATALLRFSQGSTFGEGGRALKVSLGQEVLVQNTNNTDVRSWQIDLVYVDPSSSLQRLTPYIFNDDSSVPQATITPDVRGSYRFVLKVWNVPGRVGDPTDVDIRVVCVPELSGIVAPPAQRWPRPLPTPESEDPSSKPNELNFEGQIDGWAGDGQSDGLLNDVLRRIANFTSASVEALSNVLFVDAGTTIPELDQDGSISRPFSTPAAAVDRLDTLDTSGIIVIGPGDYSSTDPIVWNFSVGRSLAISAWGNHPIDDLPLVRVDLPDISTFGAAADSIHIVGCAMGGAIDISKDGVCELVNCHTKGNNITFADGGQFIARGVQFLETKITFNSGGGSVQIFGSNLEATAEIEFIGVTGDVVLDPWSNHNNLVVTNGTKTVRGASSAVTPGGSTGDIQVNSGAATFDAISVPTDRLIGRDTAGSGPNEFITVSGGLEFTGSSGIRRSAITGDVAIAAGATTSLIGNDAVTNAKLRNSSGLSVIGRSANTGGDPDDIIATVDNTVLRRSGASIGWGTITSDAIGNVDTDRLLGRDTAGTGAVEQLTVSGGLEFTGAGGIQRSALTGDVTVSAGATVTTIANNVVSNAKLRDSAALSVIGRSVNSVGDPADIASTSDGEVLVRSSGTIVWGTVPGGSIGNIATDRLLGRDTAGTGLAEQLTVGGGIEFTGAGGIQTSAFTGDVAKSSGGTALSIQNNAVTNSHIRDSAALSVIGRSANSSGDPADIAASTNGFVLRRSSDAVGFGTIETAGIGDSQVTLTKIANISSDRILGRVAAGAGVVQELTGAQATTVLDVFTSSLKGLAPSSGGGTSNYLRADGTWAVPPGTVVPGGSTGQIQYNNGGVFDGASGIVISGSEDAIAFGATPATSGTLRYSHASDLIKVRNFTNSGDATVLSYGTTGGNDAIRLGDNGNAALINYSVRTGGTHTWNINAIPELSLDASTLNVQGNGIASALYLSSTGTVADSGFIRGPHNWTFLVGRNSGNSANVTLGAWGAATDTLDLGNGSNLTALRFLLASGTMTLQWGAGAEYTFDASKFALGSNFVTFDSSAATGGKLRFGVSPGNIINYISSSGEGSVTKPALSIDGDGTTFTDIRVGDDNATHGNNALYFQGKSFIEMRLSGSARARFHTTTLDMLTNSVTNASFYSGTGTVAALGVFRTANNVIAVASRFGSNDVLHTYVDDVGSLHVGRAAGGTVAPTNTAFYAASGGTFFFRINGDTNEYTFSASGTDWKGNFFQNASYIANATSGLPASGFIRISNFAGLQDLISAVVDGEDNVLMSVSSTDKETVVAGPGVTSGNTAGGFFIGRGGRRNGTGSLGGFRLELTRDSSVHYPMVQGADLGNENRRIVALCTMGGLTTTEMPTNSGDGVIYLSDAQIVPTTSPVGGATLYVNDVTNALVVRGKGHIRTSLSYGNPGASLTTQMLHHKQVYLPVSVPVSTANVVIATHDLATLVVGSGDVNAVLDVRILPHATVANLEAYSGILHLQRRSGTWSIKAQDNTLNDAADLTAPSYVFTSTSVLNVRQSNDSATVAWSSQVFIDYWFRVL